MDKAAVIREFLGWVGQYKHWALSAHDDVPDDEVDAAIMEFVASQAHGAKLDAIVDNLLGGIPEMLASTYMPADVTWTPTPEAERGFAAMKEQAGDAALQAAKAGLLTVVQEQIHETLSRSAKTIDSVWHAALAEPPKC